MMDYRWDILGLGCVTIDELLLVSSFPVPDTKMPINGIERHNGGQTATALVAAARLGSRCAYGGTLGYGELSDYAEAGLRAEGIDLSPATRREDASPVHAFIIVDAAGGTRTILYNILAHVGADENNPPAEVIQSARILFVDQHGMAGNIRAGKIARAAGMPIVADFEHDGFAGFDQMLPLVDHLIVNDDFAAALTGKSHPGEAAHALWTDERALVAVTCGVEGAWYVEDASGEPRHQPAFPVKVVDTTGCGDVFHGAYASALARGLSAAERIEFAAAAAALKATQAGGQPGIPTRPRVEAFIAERKA